MIVAAVAFSAGSAGAIERVEMADGRTLTGKVGGDPASGFRFVPDGGPAIALEKVGAVINDGPGPGASEGLPPFRVLIGDGGQVSGRLAGLDDKEIRMEDGPGHRPLTIERGGARAIVQRPGEVVVFRDGFETMDSERWTGAGRPSADQARALVGARSLRLPAGGSAVTCRLEQPVGSGRLELAYYEDGTRVEGQRWSVTLSFRDHGGDLESIRAVLGWSDESLAVESPGGPALAVQRLTRRAGWHRLIVRFGPGHADLAIDGDELAHGRGPGGPLVEIRIATESRGTDPPPMGLAAHVDDLNLARFAEPINRLEVITDRDEVRLVNGDQLFGRVPAADPERVSLAIDGTPSHWPWAEVSGVFFRRVPAQARIVAGQFVRLEWRTAPGNDPRDLDRAEGALVAVAEDAMTIDVPFIGRLAVPRDRLRRLIVLERARRLVLDPSIHHLGDSFDPELDSPQAEGDTLDIPITLDRVPDGPATLTVVVVQLVGVEGTPPYSEAVKAGQLRTHVLLNGKKLDDLNSHVTTPNDVPRRLRLPIAAGLLRAGANRLRFEQSGLDEKPSERDDLGILGVALEWPELASEAKRP